MMSAWANHLWQSTLFAAAAALLTFALRKNHARTRHWIWLAASVKFLVPFSLLVGVGSQFGWRRATLPQMPSVMEEFSQPFPRPVVPIAPTPPAAVPYAQTVLIAIWICGSAALTLFRWIRWQRLRDLVRAATNEPRASASGIVGFMRPSPFPSLTLGVRSSPALLEPGVFGILRPVLLLPEGIAERLTPAQLDTILAHELSHVRRHDNLTAAIHMAVEALFWFHPLVWWIGARLVEERERACDEEVLRLGGEPQVYAEGILKVCEFYLESPLVCVSGVTGANLKQRIEAIMTHRRAHNLDFGRRLLLAAAAVAAIAGPIAIGIVNSPRVRAQSQPVQAFEVASIKPIKVKGRKSMTVSPTGLTYTNVSLRDCIEAAYGLKGYQVTGPDWLDSERFDIAAKAPGPVSAEQLRQMLQPLLADRFKLTFHREQKDLPAYALLVSKKGARLRTAEGGAASMRLNGGSFVFQNYSISALAEFLSGLRSLDRPVLDMTGLEGLFDFTLKLFDDPAMTPMDFKIAMSQGREADSIFTSVQEDLGLKLEARKAAIEVLIIDHAEKVPTEN